MNRKTSFHEINTPMKPPHVNLLTLALTLTALALTASQCSLLKQSAGTSGGAKLDGLALIPAGSFKMGDQSTPPVGSSCERPVHTVKVSAFYMGKYLVTKEVWVPVRAWGLTRGYTDLSVGASKAKNHPLQTITWYDTVKWCNARSEMEGLTPCYTVSGTVYRTGNSDAVACNWNANGYRLPSEAEWEKAARGGLVGQNFPWGNTIDLTKANFSNIYDESYLTGTTARNSIWTKGGIPYTSPVGSFAPNGYGLYDMAGNVHEWCWDCDGDYTATPQTNPRGPNHRGSASEADHVARGGNWDGGAGQCRVASRGTEEPLYCDRDFGFRVARSSVP